MYLRILFLIVRRLIPGRLSIKLPTYRAKVVVVLSVRLRILIIIFFLFRHTDIEKIHRYQKIMVDVRTYLKQEKK